MVSFYILLSLMTMREWLMSFLSTSNRGVLLTAFSELVGRLLGREKALCCGEQDLLKALRSDSCTFSIVRSMNFNTYVAHFYYFCSNDSKFRLRF